MKNIKFKINYPADPISEENFILFLKHLSKKSKTIQWLVQERLFPHNKITHSFDTNTLTTLRIVTSYNRISKKSIFISAYCRIPLKDSAVDNIYLTNQFIGIDLKTGFLEDKQKSQYYNDHKDINHSRSGIPYKKIQIPYTQRIESACIRLHESLVKEPNIVPAPIIGFDIGITKNGYVFLEANAPCELIAEQEQYMAGPLLNNVSFVESLSSWFPFLDQLPIHPHFRIRQIKAALAANKDKDQ